MQVKHFLDSNRGLLRMMHSRVAVANATAAGQQHRHPEGIGGQQQGEAIQLVSCILQRLAQTETDSASAAAAAAAADGANPAAAGASLAGAGTCTMLHTLRWRGEYVDEVQVLLEHCSKAGPEGAISDRALAALAAVCRAVTSPSLVGGPAGLQLHRQVFQRDSAGWMMLLVHKSALAVNSSSVWTDQGSAAGFGGVAEEAAAASVNAKMRIMDCLVDTVAHFVELCASHVEGFAMTVEVVKGLRQLSEGDDFQAPAVRRGLDQSGRGSASVQVWTEQLKHIRKKLVELANRAQM
jgi:hypothetical protein